MQLIRLAEDYSFGPFDCGEADLNDFLLADAKDHASQLLAVTYLIESTDGVAAYFALSNDRISLSDSDKATWRRIKKDSTFACFDKREETSRMAQLAGSWIRFSWPLRVAAAEAQFPFPWEGVAEGRGRGIRADHHTADCHKEL